MNAGTFFRKPLTLRIGTHLLFWLLFYLQYIQTKVLNPYNKSNYLALFQAYGYKLLLQMMAAYFLIYFIIPRTLNHKRYVLFALSFAGWAYIIYILYILVRYAYFEQRFPEIYGYPGNVIPDVMPRLIDPIAFVDFTTFAFMPAAVMGLIRFYKNQRQLSKIEEERKTMELRFLRNQLNPHFLFNTLNNLYALALKKDDRTPGIILKLSEILDSMLYGSTESFVPLEKEVHLIDNYLALEKIRYGENRCLVVFNKAIHYPARITPLILLTLVENAFKHGVVNEEGRAEITIDLVADQHTIRFHLSNTIPAAERTHKQTTAIGLMNIQKQLELLYPNRHHIDIHKSTDRFSIELTLHEV